MDQAARHRSKVASDHMKEFDFRPVPHPPSSPYQDPSDLYLFGAIKEKMAESEFRRAEELVGSLGLRHSASAIVDLCVERSLDYSM
jgi:hypothetical protein